MRRLIDYGTDDHPGGDDQAPCAWAVLVVDDCEGCGAGEARVAVSLEPVGQPGRATVAHLAPATARLVLRSLRRALAEVGEPEG
jgi:hypothetical protein